MDENTHYLFLRKWLSRNTLRSVCKKLDSRIPYLLTAVSQDDMQKYKVPLKWRDRCAAYFALYQTCLFRQSANGSVDCHHDKHVWEECEILDLNRRKTELKEVKEKLKAENDA